MVGIKYLYMLVIVKIQNQANYSESWKQNFHDFSILGTWLRKCESDLVMCVVYFSIQRWFSVCVFRYGMTMCLTQSLLSTRRTRTGYESPVIILFFLGVVRSLRMVSLTTLSTSKRYSITESLPRITTLVNLHWLL